MIPQNPQPFDMTAMLAAFAQMQQAQQAGALAQQQNYFANTDPLGATARANSRPGGLTPGSQWSDMFGGNAASAMTPEARQASQGGSAVNQWAQPGRYAWGAPATPDPMMGAAPQVVNPFVMPQPLTSPMGNPQTDAANLQQNQQFYAGRKPMRRGSSFGMMASR